MTPAEVLLSAADGLADHDWCQGASFIDQDGKRWMLDYINRLETDPVAACAMGAICLVGMDDIEARDCAIDIFERHLAGGNEEFRPCIPKWNDDKRRTKSEVIETLRRAARNATEK